MAEQWTTRWAERIRDTNILVRIIAAYVFRHRSITADQLYGLSKLTWITKSFDGENASYIRSTKIPALGDVFGCDFDGMTLEAVADQVSSILGDSKLREIVVKPTGFTNLYPAFRNSARQWFVDNHEVVQQLLRSAYHLRSDVEGVSLIRMIEGVQGVPAGGNSDRTMHAAYLLTPIVAALDQRMRFPLINGNKGVRKVLRALKVSTSDLETQYQTMVDCYGFAGINDAADLDQLGQVHEDLTDFFPASTGGPIRKALQDKPSAGQFLPLKDEEDVLSILEARQINQRRVHNRMTNRLRSILSSYSLHEGGNKSAMYDVLVTNYNGLGDDLLIEVKSTAEMAHVRMAIGQLYSYCFRLDPEKKAHIAVMLPENPSADIKKLLGWLGIGLLWFSNDNLATATPSLSCLTR